MLKKMYFIKNVFTDEKINDYEKKYNIIEDEINLLVIQSKMSYSKKLQKNKNKVLIKSNFSKKNLLKT